MKFARHKFKCKRIKLDENPMLLANKEYPLFNSVHVQCDEKSLLTDKLEKIWKIGKITSFKTFYPEYNI